MSARDELNRWLVPMYGDKLFLDFDFSVIPELQEEMDKVVDQMSKAWWVSPNEKRAAKSYGEEENEAMNDFYIPANLLPINDSNIEMPEPQPSMDIDKMEVKYEVVGMDDHYTTVEEAEARAREMGGSGHHEHNVEGQVFYMPFNSHQEYLDNKGYHDDEEKQVSARVEKALKKKVDDHNKSVSAASKKQI